MHTDWSPDRLASTIAEIMNVLGLSVPDLADMAGVHRSTASRWGHGTHKPDYDAMRRLAVKVRQRGYRDLADALMTSAGFAVLPEGEPAPEPELVPADKWEADVLSDPDLPDDEKRKWINESRAVRSARPRQGQGTARKAAPRNAGA